MEAFRSKHPCGYFEIVADGGLGKTALAAEIVRRYGATPFFADASVGVREAKQFLTHMCGALIQRYNLGYTHLPARAGDNAAFLGEVLERAAGTAPEPVWLVVDALDEAEKPPRRANPLLLPAHLPHRVYVIATRRPTIEGLVTLHDTPHHTERIEHDSREQTSDVDTFLKRAADDERIARVLAAAHPQVAAATFVTRLREASLGNFRYLTYVLADLAAAEPGAPLDLKALPTGIEDYYAQFWDRLRGELTEDFAAWKRLYRPVIERLAVAAEPITVAWLADQLSLDPDEIDPGALRPWERLLRRVPRQRGKDVWHVEHRSFTDFLETRIDLRATHRAVAERYTERYAGQWAKWDTYGLRYALTHLVEAAELSAAPEYHELAQQAEQLALDRGFQREYLNRLGDPTALERGLARMLETIAGDEAANPLSVANAALEIVQLRRELGRPQPIFTLARDGDVERAERRLDLFSLELDQHWYHALLLLSAWLAADRNVAAARQLRDRVASELGGFGGLQVLLARVNATLEGTPPPDVSLPSPPSFDEAALMVARLSTAALDTSLLSGAQIELLNRQNRAEPIGDDGAFLAEENGPPLVALAAADPPQGEQLLRQYVALHASYGYPQYRKGSLWALLGAVLQHPHQGWVREWVTALGEAALSPNRGGYHGALGYAIRALRVEAGVPGALDELDSQRMDAITEAQQLPPPSPSIRGQGDTWGLHRRRLAALAEAHAILPGQTAATDELVDLAVHLPFGYAGFNAPACLTLAEAIQVVDRNSGRSKQALDAAQESAHNIQDPVFCARTTARYNAMNERWWSGALDVQAVTDRLRRDPAAPEFATVHVVGEPYAHRNPLTTLLLPDWMRQADTLAELAFVYQRPVDDLLRLNAERGWDADQPLTPDARASIPDPGFPPLLAARIAAHALADQTLSDHARTTAIRSLVPIAVSNPTALDVVLARLLLAERPHDPSVLDALSALARTNDESAAQAEQSTADTAMGFPA
ncbi:MAG: hypothetical protein QOF33_1710 [Thermomicrobiales bacterium]|nr:hypothetical protein [Thermomicrobiales bacterium]